MKVRPLSDVLVVELDPVPETTAGGLIRPETAPNPIRTARVVRAGPGHWWRDRRTKKLVLWPMVAKVGDRVVFHAANLETKQGRQLCHVLDDNQAIIRETDILFAVDGDVRVEA